MRRDHRPAQGRFHGGKGIQPFVCNCFSGEMGTGLCLGDLSLPGSHEPKDKVPGEGVKSQVLKCHKCFLIFQP